jgi:antitoxin component YwqK of YwqJK toxin-antitoxin module
MKKLLAATFVALLMFGCGEPPKLKTEYYDNGQKQWEGMFRDGRPDGLTIWWYESGQKRSEVNWKEGELISSVAWKPNGEKCPESNVKNGNGVVVYYNDDGTEKNRITFKDGGPVSD